MDTKKNLTDKIKQVAIYIRVSTTYQVDKDSLPLQREELINYAKYILGIEEYQVFEDAGFSGKNTDRPGYQSMMKGVRSGLFSHVLVWKLDRISRNLLDFAAMYNELKRLDVAFVSKNEQFDTSSAMGEAMLKIILVFAELERKMTSERVTATMISRASNGKWNGGRVPYGYSYDAEKKEFSIIPEEQEAAVLMCDLYESSRSLVHVSRKLNEKGYRTKAGNQWGPVGVRHVLRSPFSSGCYAYNRASLSSGEKLPNKEEDHIIVESHHDPLFPKERQDKIIAMLEANARSYINTRKCYYRKITHVFSGLLYCDNCGRMLTSTRRRKMAGDGWRPSLYLCPTRRKKATNECRDTSDGTTGEFIINFIMNMMNAQKNFQLIHSVSDLEHLLLYGKVFDDVDHLDETSLNDMYEILSANLPGKGKVKLEVKKRTQKTPNGSEVARLKKEMSKLERALERLKKLYMYSNEAMTEHEYMQERNRISAAYDNAKEQLIAITSYDRLNNAISDDDLIQRASAFIVSEKLSGSSYINYRRLAVSTDPMVLKNFFNSVLDSATIGSNGKVASIIFKNGLRHQFFYKNAPGS